MLQQQTMATSLILIGALFISVVAVNGYKIPSMQLHNVLFFSD